MKKIILYLGPGGVTVMSLLLVIIAVFVWLGFATRTANIKAESLLGKEFAVKGAGLVGNQGASITVRKSDGFLGGSEVYGPVTIDSPYPDCEKGVATIDTYSSGTITINWLCPQGEITQQISDLEAISESDGYQIRVRPTLIEQTK